MGRRSINTTKSGKFMNPTDQARKEARKRELKKNKRQRMQVRHAVLKGKDPKKIIEEMEEIDRMEFNPLQAPILNEKVLKEKRRKLKETFNRVLHLYLKEEPDFAMELRKHENDYLRRREEMAAFYYQVKNAEKVQLDQIPLPEAPMAKEPVPSQIPLPIDFMGEVRQLRSILKGPPVMAPVPIQPPPVPIQIKCVVDRKPPAPPPGTPPYLSDDEEEENEAAEYAAELAQVKRMAEATEDEENNEESQKKARKIRFEDDNEVNSEEDEKDTRSKFKPAVSPLQVMMLKMAGQVVPMMEVDKEATESNTDYLEDNVTTDDEPKPDKPQRKSKFDTPPEDYTGEPEIPGVGTVSIAKLASAPDSETDSSLTTPTGSALKAVSLPPGPPPGVPSNVLPVPPIGLPPGPPPGMPPPPPMMFRAHPPPRPSGTLPRMLPPGPPPGRPPGLPPGPPPGLPPSMKMSGLAPAARSAAQPGARALRPPGAPPGGLPTGAATSRSTSSTKSSSTGGSSAANPNVLSAPPSILKPASKATSTQRSAEHEAIMAAKIAAGAAAAAAPGPAPSATAPAKSSMTIEAKPQIKNLIGDATRFMPTALRVKRDLRDAKGRLIKSNLIEETHPSISMQPAVKAQTKDDAYDVFMREMENLL